MEPKKQWLRWTQTTKEFPKPKYHFTTHLRHVGDYVRTNPIDAADVQRIKDAAKFWAWHHDCRVSIHKDKVGKGLWEVTVRLVAHHRKHIDDELPYSF